MSPTHRTRRVCGRSLRLPVIAIALTIGAAGALPAHVRAQAAGDHATDEAAIRALVNRRAAALPAADDAIFWSGPLPRPVLGRADTAHRRLADTMDFVTRRNQREDTRIVRLDMSKAGDMAWEFSDFTVSFDRAAPAANAGAHEQFTGSALRVWEKRNGQWTIVAAFYRPHDRPI